MPKLDVKVGDEFPAEEKGQVHHHYYHFDRGCRPARPFRLLRVLLSILMIIFVVRLMSFAWHTPLWAMSREDSMPGALVGMGGLAGAIAVIALVLWLLRRTSKD